MKALTNNSEFVIKRLYKIYLERIKQGESIDSASFFGTDEKSFNNYFSEMNFEDYVSSVFQLKSKNFVIVNPGDDGFAALYLSIDGIIYCEGKFNY